MKRRLRRLAKTTAVISGGLGLYHRLKHRRHLTVLMFHRVLPSQLLKYADPEYTISTSLLESLLALAKSHYNIVGLPDVLASFRKQTPLPSTPLLVTFDDGWEDNATHAAPILAAAGVPWTLFAATDAVSSGERWWQENLLAALREGRTNHAELRAALAGEAKAGEPKVDNPDLAALMLYGLLPPDKRDALLNRHSDGHSMQATTRHMANWQTLRALQNAGVAIGGHGASHLPLTLLAQPAQDLQRAHSIMQRQLGDGACTSMSFPHGRYNAEIAGLARDLGMELLFTSDPVLNACPGGWLEPDLVGRIPISTDAIANAKGELDPERAMPWLMLRQ